jgi:type IV secretion system protein VirB9
MSGRRLALLACSGLAASAHAQADRRLQDIQYDPHTVVAVPVKRGVVTLVVLDDDEAITQVATGLGGDCSKAEAVWCIAAQPGGRHLFVKPKSGATGPNNVAVVTDRRSHTFQFTVLPDGDTRVPVYRLTIHRPVAPRTEQPMAALPLPSLDTTPEPATRVVIAARLLASPAVVNSEYSIAEGRNSDGIVPSLVFDDGRFTYFRFAGNEALPAVFHVLGDGSEALVNTRMEGDLLVADRVSRRLVLRAGSEVVAVWNDAFDREGVPTTGGTTVETVERLVKRGAPR